jgi:voltage-gated potassium channel
VSDVLFLILRRLRAPLIVLIVAYAIAVLGFTQVPGQLPDGQPWKMSVFHAFYVISYTATTIGFGELPYPFSDAQRLWLTFTIYLTVIAWTYTLGAIFTLISDATFRSAIAHSLFAWRVRALAEPFYILCGYGQSSRALAHVLDRMNIRVVVVELDKERAARVVIESFHSHPVAAHADARFPNVLRDAGISRKNCVGLLALTGDDKANQTIAIGARTLQPSLRVIARVKSEIAKVNLESFGDVAVINPFETFAANVALDLDAPEVLRLEEWLTAAPDAACPARIGVPQGAWVLVGYGRFGHYIAKILDERGIAWKAIDNRTLVGEADHQVLASDNTDSALRDADIDKAAVIVGGTDNDAINLAAITLARRRNPKIWTIIRQNHIADRVLIRAAKANLRFVQSEIMVHECLQLVNEPMLGDFLKLLRKEGALFASSTLEKIQSRVGDRAPHAWSFRCDLIEPGVFYALLQQKIPLTLKTLARDTDSDDESHCALALMLVRNGIASMLPEEDTELQAGDRVLFVGRRRAKSLQQRIVADPMAMEWLLTGQEPPRSALFRWWRARKRRNTLASGSDSAAAPASESASAR